MRNEQMWIFDGKEERADFIARAEEVLREFAETGRRFSSETVLSALGKVPPGVEPRAIGVAFVKVHRAGLIVPTGRIVEAMRNTRNGGICREWVGKKFFT